VFDACSSDMADQHSVSSASDVRMAHLLAGLATGQGFSASRLPGVKFMRSTAYAPPTPITYEPSIVVVAQGRKAGRLGGRTFLYDANHYLVLAAPLPFECETFGTPEEPMLGLSVAVTPTLVGELLEQMRSSPADDGSDPQAIESAPLDDVLRSAVVRLLECLRSPDDARILGAQIVRELVYRVLLGPLGANLRALVATHSRLGRIARVLARIHADFARPHEVESLAREAGMSVSTFHLHFKNATAASPLRYLKTIRLHKARTLMVHDGVGAAVAAGRVGYESASQFSREFKRHFGDTPAAVAAKHRADLTRFS
jgi:AraC-like DNA-binding protein